MPLLVKIHRVASESGLRAEGVGMVLRGRPVLSDVHFEAVRGSITWIGGRNGSGKTTLLRVLAGVLIPETGRVTFDSVAPSAFRRRLGYVPAGDRGLVPRLTVRQALAVSGGVSLVARRARRAAIAEVVRDLELEAMLDVRTDRLSLGQRQRLRLATALVHRPDLLLLDEPYTSLDEEGIETLARVITTRREAGATVCWCSPTNERDRLAADRGFLIEDGRVQHA